MYWDGGVYEMGKGQTAITCHGKRSSSASICSRAAMGALDEDPAEFFSDCHGVQLVPAPGTILSP